MSFSHGPQPPQRQFRLKNCGGFSPRLYGIVMSVVRSRGMFITSRRHDNARSWHLRSLRHWKSEHWSSTCLQFTHCAELLLVQSARAEDIYFTMQTDAARSRRTELPSRTSFRNCLLLNYCKSSKLIRNPQVTRAEQSDIVRNWWITLCYENSHLSELEI